jgi:O-antigen ligase
MLTVCVVASYANANFWGWYAPPNVRQVTDELWTLVPPTVEHVREKMISGADRGLLSFAGWMGILLVTADGIRSWADLDRVVTWLCRFGAVVAAIGIIQFFTGYNIASLFSIPGLSANSDFGSVATRSVLNRVSSTATHAIEFGVVMAALIPISLHRTIHRWGKPSAVVPTLLICVACAMSVSRSGVLVAGVAFLVLLAAWPREWRIRALVIAPVGIVALRLAVPGLVGTLIALFTNLLVDDSVTGRTGDFPVVSEIYQEHPWLGRGYSTFLPRYYRILDNQVFGLLLELGLIGLLAALLTYTIGFTSARRVRRDAQTAEQRHLGLAMSASILGLAVSLLTYDAWGFPIATGVTFLLLGMIGAAWRLTNDADTESPYSVRTVPVGPTVRDPGE